MSQLRLQQSAKNAFDDGKFDIASKHCAEMIEADSKNEFALALVAEMSEVLKRHQDALAVYRKLIQFYPENKSYAVKAARSAQIAGRINDALHLAEYAKTAEEQLSADELGTLGSIFMQMNKADSAAIVLRAAEKKAPLNGFVQYNLGVNSKFLGDFDSAEAALRVAMNEDKFAARAISELSDLPGGRLSDSDITKIEELQPRVADFQQVQLLEHALYRYHEQHGRYDEAFASLDRANVAQLKVIGSNLAPVMNHDSISQAFKDVDYSKLPIGDANASPIFILGLPRTGTTLVEQILSAHRDVDTISELPHLRQALSPILQNAKAGVSAMELINSAPVSVEKMAEFYIEMSAPFRNGAKYFVDKSLTNYTHVGFIKALFPNAKFLYVKRNAMDACFSVYRQFFVSSATNLHYSYDLKATAHQYRQFEKLMGYWKQLLGDQIIEIDYDHLIKSPDATIDSMITALGLSEDEGCKQFYNSKASVNTASASQVRAPITNESQGRYKHYEQWLGDLKAVLEA